MCLTFSKSEAITLRELIWVVRYRLIKEGVRREALRRYAKHNSPLRPMTPFCQCHSDGSVSENASTTPTIAISIKAEYAPLGFPPG